MIACRRLRFPVSTENFVPARACLVNLFQRMHVGIPEELNDSKPEKPKRPINGYLRFSRSVFNQYKQQNPDKSAKDIQKLIAGAWSILDVDKKNEYVKQYKDENEIYKKKLEEFKNLLSKYTFAKEGTDPDTLKLKSQLLQKPKKPPNAFLLYKASRRSEQEIKNLTFQEWTKSVAQDWRQLPEKEKNVFVEMAAKMTEGYKSEMEAWVQRMKDEGHTDVLSLPRKVKGSSVHNITLQAGAHTKTETLPNAEQQAHSECIQPSSNKRSDVTNEARNMSPLNIKPMAQPCQPVVNIETSNNVCEPTPNIELSLSTTITTRNKNNVNVKPCSDTHGTNDKPNSASLVVASKCDEKTQREKVHFFDMIHANANIKTEYLLGATCSLISLGFYLWYISYV